MFEPRPVIWGAVASMAAFYALMLTLGLWAGRRRRAGVSAERRGEAAELMLAGRSLPLGLAVLTMSATWVGGGYINGSAEAAYGGGLVWVQAPWGYALSLLLGGLVFARPMRVRGFTTLLDPLHARYGRKLAGLLYVPALAGELFWSAAILTALGTTFGAVVGLDFTTAIVVSAGVVILYTLVGGLWAVAVTDALQIVILVVGLWIVVPLAASHVGGLGAAWTRYAAATGDSLRMFPPLGGWNDPAWGDQYWLWWDTALLLVFGGIPWHVYFQRVLAARDPDTAVRLSVFASGVCLVAAAPAVLIGIIGHGADWAALGVAAPEPALVLPWVLRYLTNPWVASIGLGALAAAVMSSADSSILSASSMAAWNIYRPLIRPAASSADLGRVVRRCVIAIGAAATLIALRAQSVYALWVLCSDLVYCILFPQLVTALFDRRANRAGCAAGLLVSVVLRFGGGEPAIGLPRWLPYPMIDPTTGATLFPFRTTTMLAALIAIVVVSRLTARRYPPSPLAPTGDPERGSR